MPDQTWLVVAVIFFYFSFIFWRYSSTEIRSFKLRERGETEEGEAAESGSEELAKDFITDFEGYLNSINRLNKMRYRIGAAGFLIAGLTALVAMFLNTL